MNIEETRNKIKKLTEANKELSSMFVDMSRTIFCTSSLYREGSGERILNPNAVAYHDEERGYFQYVGFTTRPALVGLKRASMAITSIVEIYEMTSTVASTVFLSPLYDDELLVSYSKPTNNVCENFCVKVDLERITRDFPRTVERVCDAIVLLGEVVFVGGEV